jgi:mxaK protein
MAGVRRWIDLVAWLLLATALGAAVLCALRWRQIAAIDRAIASGGTMPLPASTDPRVRYAAAFQAERALRYTDAVALYTDAQGGTDARLAANAWFALGNVYFKIGIAESRAYEARLGAVFENAQLDLARDDYRSALRIDPALAGARYNLELLERLAPGRHLQGWRRNTDPVMMVPNQHNGWTSMQDDQKRGLP